MDLLKKSVLSSVWKWIYTIIYNQITILMENRMINHVVLDALMV